MSKEPKSASVTAPTLPAKPRQFVAAMADIRRSAEPTPGGQAFSKEGYDRMITSAEQFAQFHQGNVEAFLKSSQILATGLQDLTKHVATTTQAAIEEGVSTFRSLAGVKSLKEAFDLQASYTRSAVEKALSESGKLTETGLKLAEEAYAPITARMNIAVETFTKRA